MSCRVTGRRTGLSGLVWDTVTWVMVCPSLLPRFLRSSRPADIFYTNPGRKRKEADCAGNLHINIIADKWDPKVEKLIEPFVYEVVGELPACSFRVLVGGIEPS